MKSRFLIRRSSMVAMLVILISQMAVAQAGDSTNSGLYKEIAALDSVVFTAFNTRNVEQFKSMFSEDLEFYHDKGGLTGYDHTINFLKGIAQNDNQLKRELVKESLEVYPIPDYGAMQIGQHRFCHPESGKMDCGTFKFVHIWRKKDGQWRITRVVSYGH